MSSIKEIVIKNLENVAYQVFRDTPTIKYYTDWTKYESFKALEEYRIEDVPKDLIKRYDFILSGGGAIDVTRVDFEEVKIDEVFKVINPLANRSIARHILATNKAFKIIASSKPTKILSYGGGLGGHLGHHILIYVPERVRSRIEIDSIHVGNSLKSFVIEVIQERNSKLNIVRVTEGDSEGPDYVHLAASLSEGAELMINDFVKGGVMNHSRTDVKLSSEARFTQLVSALALSNDSIDTLTSISHVGERSASSMVGRGVSIEGRVVVRSLVKMPKPRTSSSISNEVLKIGDGVAIASPKLEVLTSGVEKAEHSASHKVLTTDVLHYIASRGLEFKEVVKEIVRDYLSEGQPSPITDKINKSIRDIDVSCICKRRLYL
jgi:hypothetical protein